MVKHGVLMLRVAPQGDFKQKAVAHDQWHFKHTCLHPDHGHPPQAETLPVAMGVGLPLDHKSRRLLHGQAFRLWAKRGFGTYLLNRRLTHLPVYEISVIAPEPKRLLAWE
jgi:hypothetical protein